MKLYYMEIYIQINTYYVCFVFIFRNSLKK